MSDVNFKPSSTDPVSGSVGPGVVVVVQKLHGHAPVVNVQVKSTASGFPAASVTPAAPLLIVAVYNTLAVSAAVGVNVTMCVAAAYATVAATSVVPGPASVTVVPLIVAAAIAS